MKRGYVTIPEGQVHYREEGSGEPLVLLHQASFSSEEFRELIPLLNPRYRVIAPDMLGYGMSDPNPPGYDIKDYARAGIGFLQALGVKRASFIGIHTGAAIAVELAAVYPEAVDKLVLYGMPSFTPDVREACVKSRMFSPVEVKADGSHLERLWRAAIAMGDKAAPEIWNMNVVAMGMASGGAFHGEHAIFRFDEEARLPLVKAPTLLVTGTLERFFRHRLDATRKMLPRCRTQVIEGTSSFAALEKPAELARAALEFLTNPAI